MKHFARLHGNARREEYEYKQCLRAMYSGLDSANVIAKNLGLPTGRDPSIPVVRDLSQLRKNNRGY
jgi:hypothetical protein